MKSITVILVALLVLSGLGMAQAQEARKTISQVLDSSIKTAGSDFIPAAEALTEEKYGFVPTNGEFKGVRTFAEQIKHVAASNYLIGAHVLGEKPPVDANDGKGPDSVDPQVPEGLLRLRP